MRLNIFVDGNSIIGLGHIYRCIGIADYFISRNVDCRFFVPHDCSAEILLGKDIITIPNKIWKEPYAFIEYFGNYLKKDDLILLDLLEKQFIKFKFLQELKLFIASITLFRFKDKSYFGNISFFPSMDSNNSLVNNVSLFSGTDYFILQKSIVSKKGIHTQKNEIPTILVTMGGADPYNLSEIILDALDLIKENFKAIILLGRANQYKNKLIKRLKGKNNYEYYEQVSNIEDFYLRSDFAIINGGNTRYELSFLQVPYFCISIHKTQYEISQKAIDRYGGINLGVYTEISIDYIANKIQNYIKNPSIGIKIKAKMKSCNLNKGAQNIFKLIMKYYNIYSNEEVK